MLSQNWHNRVVTRLMVAAMGDLMLTVGRGDLAYRQTYDSDTLGDLPAYVCRPAEILARISRDGWTLNPAGAQFILENCPPVSRRELSNLRQIAESVQ